MLREMNQDFAFTALPDCRILYQGRFGMRSPSPFLRLLISPFPFTFIANGLKERLGRNRTAAPTACSSSSSNPSPLKGRFSSSVRVLITYGREEKALVPISVFPFLPFLISPPPSVRPPPPSLVVSLPAIKWKGIRQSFRIANLTPKNRILPIHGNGNQ